MKGTLTVLTSEPIAIVNGFRVATLHIPHHIRILLAFSVYDPEPGVPREKTPMVQCAFEAFVFEVSAVHTIYRS